MILVRHAEIYTKAEPTRTQFINRLAENIRRSLPGYKVSNLYWRLVVDGPDDNVALDALSRVFGVASFSPAVQTALDMKELTEQALSFCVPKKTFAVRTQRIDKNFLLTSQQVNEQIGQAIVDEKKLKVNLSKPQQEIGIEILR